jgi:hypothetical protein
MLVMSVVVLFDIVKVRLIVSCARDGGIMTAPRYNKDTRDSVLQPTRVGPDCMSGPCILPDGNTMRPTERHKVWCSNRREGCSEWAEGAKEG